jgi:hypothetical protein
MDCCYSGVGRKRERERERERGHRKKDRKKETKGQMQMQICWLWPWPSTPVYSGLFRGLLVVTALVYIIRLPYKRIENQKSVSISRANIYHSGALGKWRIPA